MTADILTITKEFAIDLMAACVDAERLWLDHINSDCENTNYSEDECREFAAQWDQARAQLSSMLQL